MKTILFHSNQLAERGTEVSLYNYAYYNEMILGNRSIIAAPANKDLFALPKFKEHFEVLLYTTFDKVEEKIKDWEVDWFYAQKGGRNDGILSKQCKNFIHAVFCRHDPHGEIYAYISRWLSSVNGNGNFPYLPYIVTMPDTKEDFRRDLNIPAKAIVYGRHGGFEEFNLPFVKTAIIEVVKNNPNIYFLFVNTEKFYQHPQIIFLGKTHSNFSKRIFVNTCDAMLHARANGESFGLAIAEFLYCNKPVICWSNGIDKNHLEMLGEDAITYDNYNDILNLLTNLKYPLDIDYKKHVEEFSPAKVIEKFDRMMGEYENTSTGPR